MSSFQDTTGRTWAISIQFKSCKQVLEATGVNLLDLRSIDDTLARLRFDHLIIGDIVQVLCGQECKARELSLDSFVGALDGESLSRASDAILEGLRNFFQRSPTGPLLGSLIDKLRTLESEAIRQAIANITPATTPGESGDSATVSPAS